MKKVVKLKENKRKSKFYVTTAIPYVNADPHIGHALEFVQTDAIRRWNQLTGKETFLTTGSDENSLKNVQAAEERGISTAELCAINAEKFRELARLIGLHYNSFLRSSLPDKHYPGVHKLWKLCDKAGDIYKKKYRGLYCVGCEAFYTESELKNGKCPEHNCVPQVVEEENYFFRLSKYQKQLEKLIEADKLKIFPETRKHEVLSFIKSGLEDISISRSVKRAKGWGVPVPGDSNQIIYVWFDALNIYQTALGFGIDENLYKEWWPCDLHVIGKGILRFHAVYWPAILLSAGLPLPESIFVHGYVTVEGQKMSKSLGNVVNPLPLIKEYGADRLRYYLLREIPPFDDGNFSEADLIERANKELVENFSNLFYRITSFVENNFGGLLPYGRLGKEEKTTQESFAKKTEDVKKSADGFRLNEALSHVMELSSELNRYFQSKKPWKNPKEGTALYFSANMLKDICTFLYPFIPFTVEKALNALNCKLDIKNVGRFTLKKGHKIKSEMLFKKVECKGVSKGKSEGNKSAPVEQINMVNNTIPKQTPDAKHRQSTDFISIDEFKKLDLRIGTITDVQDHPNADKLFVLQVDLGTEKRQLVAGLKGIYPASELKGKQVVVVCNLEQKELRGIRSEGMLLASNDGTILSPSKKVVNGSTVS